jgi:hypothetical protein
MARISIYFRSNQVSELRVGFITWEPNYNDPKMTGAAPQAPPPGTFTTHILGGPRSVERIKQEIATLEKHLGYLKSELSGHPDYARTSAGESGGK